MKKLVWEYLGHGRYSGASEGNSLFFIACQDDGIALTDNRDNTQYRSLPTFQEAMRQAEGLFTGATPCEHTEKEGKKYDNDKTRFDLVDPAFEEALAEVLTYGASKYGADNWRGVEPERYYAALRRHLCAWRKGEKADPESGLGHLAHCIANLMFLFHYDKEDKWKR